MFHLSRSASFGHRPLNLQTIPFSLKNFLYRGRVPASETTIGLSLSRASLNEDPRQVMEEGEELEGSDLDSVG